LPRCRDLTTEKVSAATTQTPTSGSLNSSTLAQANNPATASSFNSLRQDNLDVINDEIEKTPGHWRELKMEVVWTVVDGVKATTKLFSGNDTDVYHTNLMALKELRERNEGEREDGHMWKDGMVNYLRVSY
jgi:hypothetical protein